jgi:hypothetical protein
MLPSMASMTGCAKAYLKSIGGDTIQVLEKIYLTDFDTAWQSVLEALKHNQLDISNRDSGFIQTKWVDNTAERNFADTIGNTDVYLKAQYRFQISVSKGFYNGRPSVKVSVQREQLIQKDVLEGWAPLESDGIEENTLLYRIGRLILIRMKLAKLEEEKAKSALEKADF